MKKLSILAVVFAAIAFAACGNKSAQNTESADSVVKSFEQEQIEASIKMHVDSLASEIGKLKMVPFLQEDGNGGIKLTKEELQVKPDYLLPASVAENATILAEKYRILSALDTDRRVAKLYEMDTDEYDKAITKLAADINDPSFKDLDDNKSIAETSEALYKSMESNGRLNYFWQLAASSLVEQLYLANQNPEKYLSTFTDDAASNTTFRIVLILDALNRLSEYDPEIKPVSEALAPLEVLNATSLDELRSQLAEAKDKINAARESLIKK
jgi:hypothetical protein